MESVFQSDLSVHLSILDKEKHVVRDLQIPVPSLVAAVAEMSNSEMLGLGSISLSFFLHHLIREHF